MAYFYTYMDPDHLDMPNEGDNMENEENINMT